MRFGLFGGALQRRGESADSQGYRGFIDQVVAAEALGFESVFLVEHHFSGIGQLSATLNLLSFLAARTGRMRLGTAVTVLPWHNPVLLAEEAATVDLLSGGRLDLGIGKGYRDIEFKGFRIPKDEAEARFEEALALLKRAWTSEERFSWHGRWWQFEDVVVEPAPVQKPHPPLWTGAGTPASIARVAQSGLRLLLDQFGSFDLTRERLAAFRAACRDCGRAFDPMEVGLTRAIIVTQSAAETAAAREARAARNAVMDRFGRLPGLPSYAEGTAAPDDAAIIGEPEAVIARLRELEAMGFGYVLALITGGADSLRLLAREVMPEFAPQERLASFETPAGADAPARSTLFRHPRESGGPATG